MVPADTIGAGQRIATQNVRLRLRTDASALADVEVLIAMIETGHFTFAQVG